MKLSRKQYKRISDLKYKRICDLTFDPWRRAGEAIRNEIEKLEIKLVVKHQSKKLNLKFGLINRPFTVGRNEPK